MAKVGFDSFCKIVKDLVEAKLPQCDITMQCITKNNSTEKTCLIIKSKEANGIAPCIYLQPYYTEYLNNEGDYEEICMKILAVYELSKDAKERSFAWISDYDQCKDNICFKLVNHALNEAVLCDMPSIPYNDLEIVFYLFVGNEDDNISSIQITNQLLKSWNVESDKLLELALKNTPRLFPMKVSSMASVLYEICNGSEGVFDDCQEDETFLIVSNAGNVNGASVLLYDDFFECIVAKYPYLRNRKRLIIIPSSIHECLVLDPTNAGSISELREMVSSINADEKVMKKEDILSSSVYYYYPDEKKLMLAEEDT